VAREHRLPPFRLATIHAEQRPEEIVRRLEGGQRVTGLDGRPDLSPIAVAEVPA
jgi:hypothetical protein